MGMVSEDLIIGMELNFLQLKGKRERESPRRGKSQRKGLKKKKKGMKKEKKQQPKSEEEELFK